MSDPLHVRVRRKARRTALVVPNALRREAGLRRLRATGDPRLARVADALDAFGTPPDHPAIAEVERARAEMRASEATFPVRMAEVTGDASDTRVAVDTVGRACRRSASPAWAALVFHLVRALRPARALELGTCVGVSAAYQSAALERNGTGRLVTVEALAGHVELAHRTLDRTGLAARVDVRHGRFDDVLPEVLAELAPLDFAFVDGHHDGEATLRYAAALAPALADGAVVLFDDISFSDGMAQAWEALARDPAASAAIDLGPMGLRVHGAGRGSPPRRFAVPLAVKPGPLDRGWLRGG